VPVEDCAQVVCPMVAVMECPPGHRAVRLPDDCCGFGCEPEDCALVACPAVIPDCPDGSRLVIGAPECCPRCELEPNCYTDADCAAGEICSTSFGDCQSSCGPDQNCLAVCMGFCLPGFCPLDFICADGSLPRGPECLCDTDVCLLDFICADGSMPLGAECRCPDECLLDFLCANGSQPQGRECLCPGQSGDVCYSDSDCQSGVCSTSTGACDPVPGCSAGAPCITVCSGTCR
jgi:hypothetical protein